MQEAGTGRNSKILRIKRKFRIETPRKRLYTYISTDEILDRLRAEGCPISEDTFRRLMLEKNLFMMERRGRRWTATPYQARAIVELIKEWYKKPNLFENSESVL